MKMRSLIAFPILLALVACGGDGIPTEPDPTPSPDPDPTVETVQVSPAEHDLGEGVALQMDVTVTGSDGAEMQGVTVDWSSSDESVATVDGSGVVTGVFEGGAEITATADGVSGKATLTVLGRLMMHQYLDSDGNWEIYAVNREGSGVANLTNSPAKDWLPEWSPDGSRIAYVSDGRLHAINADGTDVTELTGNVNSPAAWSPDGGRLAYPAVRADDTNLKIYLIDDDGSGETRLTAGDDIHNTPVWSPAGDRILFQRRPAGDLSHDLHIVSVADGTVTDLTQGQGGSDAEWSPDGSRIAFETDRDGNDEIYAMDPDGSAVTNLTQHAASDGNAHWSPDGTRIVFDSDRAGTRDIYVMNADGSGVTLLYQGDGLDTEPRWSPDGQRIVFNRRTPSDTWEAWVMNADGTGAVKVAENDTLARLAIHWRPRP